MLDGTSIIAPAYSDIGISMKDLEDVASRFQAAASQLSSCELAVAQDKAGRRGSMTRRLLDYLFDTAPEKALEAAEDRMAVARKEAADAVTIAVSGAAMRLLSLASSDVDRRKVQFERLRAVREGSRSAEKMLGLAKRARSALHKASEACSSASSMELMDTVSSNKGISVMSSVSTSNARSAVAEAQEALADLRNAVDAAARLKADVDVPDDMLDLVIDFAIDLPFDFLSLMNMSKLDSAGEKCDEAKDAVSAIIPRLKKDVDLAREALQREESALAAIDGPYIRKASVSVPAPLHFAIPRSMGELSLRP